MGLFDRLAKMEREGGIGVLATVIKTHGSVPRREGSKMLILPDGKIEGTIGGGEMEGRVIQAALESLKDGKPRILKYAFVDPEKGDVGVCGGEIEVFVDPLSSNTTLVVVGGGHVGKSVVQLAKWLGFRVVVCDDRPEFATPDEIPDADAYLVCPLEDLPSKMEIHERTYVVLTTRGVDVDVVSLPALLKTRAAYIGVIGSRRRWETTAQRLQEMDLSAEEIGRVTSPMGLEINAETPEEIALSILSEIVMIRRGGSGEAMAHTPISQRKQKGV